MGINAAAKWMRHAIEMAHQAQTAGEVPIGAVLVQGQRLIAQAGNACIANHDASAHAEIILLRAAGAKLKNYRLPGCTVYVTLEPCMMCVGALIHARIERVVFAAYDNKTGAITSRINLPDSDFVNHRLVWQGGIFAAECQLLLQQFFKSRR